MGFVNIMIEILMINKSKKVMHDSSFNGINAGEAIKQMSTKPHFDIAVHDDYCYTCPVRSRRIDVYKWNDWHLLRSIQLPEFISYGLDLSTISEIGEHINVSCRLSNKLIKLNLRGRVKSTQSLPIKVKTDSQDAVNREREETSHLSCPMLCQEDNNGNVLIADEFNNRLLVLTDDGVWHDVTPDHSFERPTGALWLNGCLYVSSGCNTSITMFT